MSKLSIITAPCGGDDHPSTLEMIPDMKRVKRGFQLISKDAYVDLFLKDNPGEDRSEVISRLDESIAAYRNGVRCNCGSPIWIIGSAEAGLGCFSCISGEADPEKDFEIDLTGV